MAVRAIRGAIQVDGERAGTTILTGTSELVTEVMTRNALTTDERDQRHVHRDRAT